MDWVYRLSDGVFLRDKGRSGLVAGEAVVDLPRTPDMERERYGDAATPIRPATALELTALKQERAEAQATRLRDDVLSAAIARVAWEEIRKYQIRAGQTALSWDEFRAAIKAEIVARMNA
jgi:hypothetical protein